MKIALGKFCLALVFVIPMHAQAVVVTVAGSDWDVTLTDGSFEDNQAQLELQPWWGSETLAASFSSAVAYMLGTGDPTNQSVAIFAYAGQANAEVHGVIFRNGATHGIGTDSSVDYVNDSGAFRYAVANAPRPPVPTPAPASVLILALGLAGLWRVNQYSRLDQI